MVACTVHNFTDQIEQICGTLRGYGYDVWNSHIGTLPYHTGLSNLDNCVRAAQDCDVFVGIIRPYYGSGIIGERSITHNEIREAIGSSKPRCIMAHHDVLVCREVLKQFMYDTKGARKRITLRKNGVMSDIRVIDMYNDAIRNDMPADKRTGNWVHTYFRTQEILPHIAFHLGEIDQVRKKYGL